METRGTEEQNPNSAAIDQMDTLGIVRVINAEDQTVALAVERALPQIAQAVDLIVERLRGGGRLFYIGAGTSGRLGVLDASECPPTYGVPPELVQGIIAGGDDALRNSIEGAEDEEMQGAEDLRHRELIAQDVVVGIAASGRTPYVLGALAYARQVGAATIGISNNAPAPLLDSADIAIPVVTGAEVIAGSTRMKSGTAQKLVLNMLSTATMVKLGKVYGNLMVDVQAKNVKLRQRAQRLVSRIAGVDEAQASALLSAADYDVKVAVVMARRSTDADTARALLNAASGFLRSVIDE
ncbi:MAG: N-acetylmuramic acid 6-phosphate etherase [Chloroflexota bacterium]|nr:N-acetylmuramic acid 6-phosphate etherase [Chloroflexota bacterium]